MGSRRDRIANEKIIDFFVPQAFAIGTHSSGTIDLRNAPAVVGAPGGGKGREIITNVLFAISIGAGWGAGGTLNFEVFTGDVAATVTSFATFAVITQATGEDLYLSEIRDLQRFINLQCICGGAECPFICVIGNGERSRREPVFQLGTELTVTYTKNPAGAMTGP